MNTKYLIGGVFLEAKSRRQGFNMLPFGNLHNFLKFHRPEVKTFCFHKNAKFSFQKYILHMLQQGITFRMKAKYLKRCFVDFSDLLQSYSSQGDWAAAICQLIN